MNTTRLFLRGTPARGLRLGALFGLCALSLVFTLALTASTSGTSGAATLRTAAKQSANHKPSSAKSFSAFQKCLSKHGLKLPARGGSSGGPPSGFTPPSSGASGGTPPSFGGSGGFGGNSKAQAALKQCASLQPKGGFPGGPGGAGGSSSTAFAAYRNCMKLHGVTVPSVTPGSSTSTPSTVDTSSPTYQAAQTACKALLPTGTGTHAGGFGLRGSRLANPLDSLTH